MEWALGLIFFALISMNLLHNSRLKELAAKLEKPAPVAAVEAPLSPGSIRGHKLIKVYDNRLCDHDRQGWWFKCECGMDRPSAKTNSKSYGSEQSAVTSYKAHVELMKSITGDETNPFEAKYHKEHAAFNDYISKCYCKDTNDDLRLVAYERSLTTKPISE